MRVLDKRVKNADRPVSSTTLKIFRDERIEAEKFCISPYVSIVPGEAISHHAS